MTSDTHALAAQRAQHLLSQIAGHVITLTPGEPIAGFSHVSRAELVDAPADWPKRVIIKTPQRPDRRARLLNHAAGLALLAAVSAAPAQYPQLLGVDDVLPLVVAADLGGSTLRNIVAAGDAAQIARALVHAAQTAGYIQAAANGHGATYAAIRAPYGSLDPAPTRDPSAFLRQSYPALVQLCGALDFNEGAATKDYYALAEALEQQGPFTTYTIYDHHAANWVDTADGLAIVDLDWGAYRLGLLDLAALRILDVAPDSVVVAPSVLAQMEAVYRAALLTRMPEASDEAAFADALVMAAAYWALFYVVGYGPRVLHEATEPYALWARRQTLRALADYTILAPRSRRWSGLYDLLRRIEARLIMQWREL